MISTNLLPFSAAIRDFATQSAIRQLEALLAKTIQQVNGTATGAVQTSRLISTTAPLTGGGTLAHDLTLAINAFSTSGSGVVPASGGGTTNFLRADGTWAVPGGGVPTGRLINTTAPLTGGGDLSADRTLAVSQFGSGASGIVPASGGGSTKYLRADGVWTIPSASAGSSFWFGPGPDGTITFDGSSTILGLVPSSNVYTLTRDIYPATTTVNNGVTIKLGGYRIFCQGTLTNNGVINDDGNPGSNASGGSTGTGGAARAAGFYGATLGGANGGGSSSTAGAILQVPFGVTSTVANGGSAGVITGGAGGNATDGTIFRGGGGGGGGATGSVGTLGGSGGGVTVQTPVNGDAFWLVIQGGRWIKAGSSLIHATAGGGGSLGAGSTPGAGGGGGAAGGIAFLCAATIAGTGTITANGGNGGNGGNATAGGGGGGGGGGAGGVVMLVYGTRSGQTVTANGGTKGTHGTGAGGGNGGDGGNGGGGIVFLINVSGDGT